ncbi:hypothetical protein M0804_007764 [Polistes exclamans]|nr:hypothetical protein M0804_007764 [Polistes exclamans]
MLKLPDGTTPSNKKKKKKKKERKKEKKSKKEPSENEDDDDDEEENEDDVMQWYSILVQNTNNQYSHFNLLEILYHAEASARGSKYMPGGRYVRSMSQRYELK